MSYALRSRLSPIPNEVFWRCQLSRSRHPFTVESLRRFATREEIDDEETGKPTKYTSSLANAESAQYAREKVTRDDRPWSQTISLGISLAAFLIYFGMLREENDIDDSLFDDISDKVPGFKEVNDKLKANIVSGRTPRMP